MARLRWTLLLLALGIGLPAALIVSRATESLELENAYRHETVAARVFDEMERSLSDFLLREESRAASDFDALSVRGIRALSETPFAGSAEPFVLGWFALGPRDETRVLTVAGVAPDRIETALRAALQPGLATHDADEMFGGDAKKEGRRVQARAPAPGRTRSVGREEADLIPSEDRASKDKAESSAYEVLQSLNRAGSRRSERQGKARVERALEQRRERFAEAPALAEALGYAEAPAIVEAERAPGAIDDALGAFSDAGAAPSALAEPAQRTRRDGAGQEAGGPVVDPLIGRVGGERALVLVRSVWRGADVERQGVVLDRDRLVETLTREILTGTELSGRAAIEFIRDDSAIDVEAPRATGYRYLHRFAEPFDDLVARLDLEPLPGLDTARSLHVLALLLGVALLIGLFAVDRMTRVVVDYAQRRSDFVAAVSHELKTPLTSIRLYGEMLRDGLVASETKRAEYYATITDESERLSRLIDNVLEFSRLEQDRRDLDLVVGGLADTVRSAVDKLEAHAAREGFTLETRLDEALPRVAYDHDAITQIVFNLVDNALKYARGASTKRIEVVLAAAGEAVELRVRDHGPGVEEGELSRIFEPFYRVGEELTRTSEGTGIGLALTRELVAGMGGTVTARKPEGGGLEVVVRIGSA